MGNLTLIMFLKGFIDYLKGMLYYCMGIAKQFSHKYAEFKRSFETVV